MVSDVFKWSRRKRMLYCFADSVMLCRALLDGGARIIQLRAKNLDDDAFRRLAEKMQVLMRAYPAPTAFIVNDRVDIALEIGVDGIHVGQDDYDYRKLISTVPAGMVVGVSVGTVDEALDAQKAGATYVGAGAVFPTPTKNDAEIIGLSELERIVDYTEIPVVAIGGINLANIDQVLQAGAHYFAVISVINSSGDIKNRIDDFEQKLSNKGVLNN